MNALRKIWFLSPIIVAAGLLVGCDSRNSAPAQTAASSSSPLPAVSETEPPPPQIAGAQEKGQASLTRNFYFVFDGSGSMGENCGGDRVSKIVGAKKALKQFMRIVPTNCDLGLFVFDVHGIREVVPLAPDNRDQFLDAVDEIHPSGGTPLGEAIEFGVARLAEQRNRQLGYGDFRLVVVTDGEANGKVSLSRAAEFAQAKGIPIYTIGLCIGHDHELRKSSVSYRAANSIGDLQKGLEETLGETEAFDAASFDEAKSK